MAQLLGRVERQRHSARYMMNSIFVAGVIVVIQIDQFGDDGIRTYSYEIPAEGYLYRTHSVGYMIPSTAVYLPGYIVLGKLNLLNPMEGLILSNCVSVFSIFLIRQAFLQVSHELVEAGQIDGASTCAFYGRFLFRSRVHPLRYWRLLRLLSNTTIISGRCSLPKVLICSLYRQGCAASSWKGVLTGLKWPLIMAASAFTIAPLLLSVRFDAEDDHSKR